MLQYLHFSNFKRETAPFIMSVPYVDFITRFSLYVLFILMLVLEKSFFGEKELLVLPPGCTLFVTLRQLASLI